VGGGGGCVRDRRGGAGRGAGRGSEEAVSCEKGGARAHVQAVEEIPPAGEELHARKEQAGETRRSGARAHAHLAALGAQRRGMSISAKAGARAGAP
jgi:hypothetical protein